jgi:putative membrane protein insertion efficiency factor
MVMRSLGILLISVLYISPALADETADLRFILKSNPIETPQQQEYIRSNFEETSELKLLSTGLIRIYQEFISTQDLPLCNFTPSCSRFGMAAIQNYGLLRGLLLTADRLLRDHGMIWIGQYKVHPYTGKHFNPIEDYSPEALTK